ncbi:MAG: hypothetical protein ACREFG_07945, partial [Chthoniobacterales bacterium]
MQRFAPESPRTTVRLMCQRNNSRRRVLAIGLCWVLSATLAGARPSGRHRALTPSAEANPREDDSLVLRPPKDLALQHEGERKAQALTSYVEALDLQEQGESEKA